MQLTWNNKDYDIVIEKKRGQKNTYIRVKKDLKVTVTTGILTTTSFVQKLIEDNYERIGKMIDFQEKKFQNNNGFFYLGKQYIIIYLFPGKFPSGKNPGKFSGSPGIFLASGHPGKYFMICYKKQLKKKNFTKKVS